MEQILPSSISLEPTFEGPSSGLEPHWYAVYTCARHEKRVADQLAQRSVEQFLPLYETVHRWKDRRMRLQLPLFPSYVFVRTALLDRLKILQIPGVVRFVSFNAKPIALPDFEMTRLRAGLASGLRAEPYPYLTAGRRVRIKAGPLCGLTGKLVRRKDNYRVVLSVDSIGRSIICEVPLEDIDVVSHGPAHDEAKLPGKTRSVQRSPGF